MRFFSVKKYRLFLLICLIAVFFFGSKCYYDSINSDSMPVAAYEIKQVYASGKIVGIYEQTSGVLVVDIATIKDKDGDECSPCNGKLKSGDYIYSINGKAVSKKEDMVNLISSCNGKDLTIKYKRNGKKNSCKITPAQEDANKYAIGLWVKDDMAGIGTITCYDQNGKFVALGHGIGNGTNGDLLSVNDGCIYDMDLSGITKGTKGVPGELSGIIYYGRKTKLGNLTGNSEIGVSGKLDKEEYQQYSKKDKKYTIAYKNEIKKEKAVILSEISGKIESYDIEILDVDSHSKDANKGIFFQVTDKRLLEKSGGIIQGMSGSPIIQNGKIVGAVTHVLVNDPTRGYGIFIENMLANN